MKGVLAGPTSGDARVNHRNNNLKAEGRGRAGIVPCLLLVISSCLLAGVSRDAFAGEYCTGASQCRQAVERIEKAYAIGREKAANDADVLLSLQLRNRGLRAMAEITYESTLAWLSDSPEQVASLENEQGEWIRMLEACPEETAEQLEETSALLLARLDVFERIIDTAFAR